MSVLSQFRIAVQGMGAYPAQDKIAHIVKLVKAMPPSVSSDAVEFLLVNSMNSAAPNCIVPLLYILDATVKQVGGQFYESSKGHIYAVFCNSFKKVGNKDKVRMYRLLQAWERYPKPDNPSPLYPDQTGLIRTILQPWIDEQAGHPPKQGHHPPTNPPPPRASMIPVPPPTADLKRPRPESSGSGSSGSSSSGSEMLSRLDPMVVIEMRRLLQAEQSALQYTGAQCMSLEELTVQHGHLAANLKRQADQKLASGLVGPERDVRRLLVALAVHAHRGSVDGVGKRQRFSATEAGRCGEAASMAADGLVKAFRQTRLREFIRMANAKPPVTIEHLKDGGAAKNAALKLFSLPYECFEDGMRFKTEPELRTHEEILEQRQRQRNQSSTAAEPNVAASSIVGSGASTQSRAWCSEVGVWEHDTVVLFGGEGKERNATTLQQQQQQKDLRQSEGQQRSALDGKAEDGSGKSGGSAAGGGKGASVVPVDRAGEGLSCRICGDAFETIYDDDNEEWVYTNAVTVRIVESEDLESSVDDNGDSDHILRGEYVTVHASCAENASARNGTVRRSILMSKTPLWRS